LAALGTKLAGAAFRSRGDGAGDALVLDVACERVDAGQERLFDQAVEAAAGGVERAEGAVFGTLALADGGAGRQRDACRLRPVIGHQDVTLLQLGRVGMQAA
jgi:hypothetical protein